MQQICKIDEDRRMVFGWASMSRGKDGRFIVDSDDEFITIDVLEKAVYLYVIKFRSANEQHVGLSKGVLIESFVVTPAKLAALGLAADALPLGWWVGYYVEDEVTWGKIKKGEYTMFSIEGRYLPGEEVAADSLKEVQRAA